MLPQELLDHIVDHCQADVLTLRACSLTSKALLRSSRPLLFRTINVTSQIMFDRFLSLVSTSPGVATCVRELHFNTYEHFMRRDPFIWFPNTASFPVATLPRLLTLAFSYVRFDRLALNQVFYAALERYRGIKEVRIFACDFQSLEALEDFIWRFAPHPRQAPRPFAVTLDCVNWGGVTEDSLAYDTIARRHLCITALTVANYSRPSVITSWLLRTPSRLVLRHVSFRSVMGFELAEVANFLQVLGDGLEELELGLRLDGTPRLVPAVRDYFNLSRNTRLRSLHLRILNLDQDMMSWVVSLLLQATHLQLKRMTFDICLHDPAQLRAPVWDDIESMLSSRPFQTVQEFLFVHRGDLPGRFARFALNQRLPELARRNVLRMQDCSISLSMW